MKLVEPLDLRITTKTLDMVIDYPDAVYWDTSDDDEFKKNHPLVLISININKSRKHINNIFNACLQKTIIQITITIQIR